jgi:dimethylamine/trimethylamine dehydrogenase
MPRDPRHDILFEPVRIGPKTLKNRFYQVPQCTGAGALKPGANAAHRAVKAEGGWAALCTESCSIHPEINQSTSICTTLWDEGDVIAHGHMTDECHKWCALAGAELGAGGVKDTLQRRYLAAAFDHFPPAASPRSIPCGAKDIRRIMYADAARRAIDAGFDILYIRLPASFPAHAIAPFNRRRTAMAAPSRIARASGSRP